MVVVVAIEAGDSMESCVNAEEPEGVNRPPLEQHGEEARKSMDVNMLDGGIATEERD